MTAMGRSSSPDETGGKLTYRKVIFRDGRRGEIPEHSEFIYVMTNAHELMVVALFAILCGCNSEPQTELRPYLKLQKCAPVADPDSFIGVVRSSAQKFGYEFSSADLTSETTGQALILGKGDLEINIILTDNATNIAFTTLPNGKEVNLPEAMRAVAELPLHDCGQAKSVSEFG